MSSSLGEIRARVVWHIVFAWHFCVHASTSSESLAESVGSFLSSLRRQNVSHSLGTKRIAWGAQLKSAGLKGTGGEDGIMAMALNVHFDTQGPEGWHFVSKSSADGGKTSLVHFRSQARLCNQPAWVTPYLTPRATPTCGGEQSYTKRTPLFCGWSRKSAATTRRAPAASAEGWRSFQNKLTNRTG